MAALQYLAPEFIREGRLCWLRSPLYIVEHGTTEDYYFTDAELAQAKGKIKGEVHRNKGLGSLEADQANRSMFSEQYQRLDVLEWSEDATVLLAELMGEDSQPRKEFILDNVDFSLIRE